MDSGDGHGRSSNTGARKVIQTDIADPLVIKPLKRQALVAGSLDAAIS